MNPDHARIFAEAGMSKQDVRDWLVANCGKTEREPENIDEGVSLVLGQGAEADRHIIFPHLADLPSNARQAARRRSCRTRPSSMLTTRPA